MIISVMMKRLFDLTLSLIAAVILFIPFVIIYLLIKLTSNGPAIFWSKRIGKNNVFFMMPKFRTMYVNTTQVATHLLDNPGSTITPFGKFLRKTSLDEIPQLLSIIKGDMSFVGPRPALFNQDDLKKMRTDAGIHKLIPGLTGWAQINGRDEILLVEKVKLDREYLEKRSMAFDLNIIVLTCLRVFGGVNVSH